MHNIISRIHKDHTGLSILRNSAAWKIVVAALLFLTAMSANFWLISKYGNSTPFWDSWDAETGLYISFFDSHLTFGELFSYENEHRILTTRLLELLLIELNGLWDPNLQMMINAIIHVGYGVFFLLAFRDRLDALAYCVLAFLILIITTVPFAYESTLWGFETHFYAVTLFGLIAIWLISREQSLSLKWFSGFAAAIL